MSKKNPIIEKKLADGIMEGFLRSAINDGLIEVEGKSEDQIKAEWFELAKKMLQDKSPVYITIDHTQEILRQANHFSRLEKREFAIMFYALWIEHWANDIIFIKAKSLGFGVKEIEQIIRNANFNAKITWLFHLMGLPPIKPGHLKTLFKIMEHRNSFVHYKWKGFEADDNKHEDELKTILNNIEKVTDYLKNYYRKNVEIMSKKKIKKILK